MIRGIVDGFASFAVGWVMAGGLLALIGGLSGSAWVLYLGLAFEVSGSIAWVSTRIVATREGWPL